jgi:hypothetical protein
VPAAFPNGCHVAEVEIDPETGVIEVVKYASANDFGTVINPLLVEGQMHGGLVQGIGQALMENTVYDEDGQPVTGLRRAAGLRRAELRHRASSGAGEDQSARHQGLWRGRLRRGAGLGHERRRRCAVGIRHPPYRHAGDAGTAIKRAQAAPAS